jgi:hypothetical protein
LIEIWEYSANRSDLSSIFLCLNILQERHLITYIYNGMASTIG